jgi:hypothetical protein
MISTFRMIVLAVTFLILVSMTTHAGVAGEESASGLQIKQAQITVVPKGDCNPVYVGGFVFEEGSNIPIAGALVTATYRDDEGIDDIYYYNNTPEGAFFPSSDNASHCTTYADGSIHLRIDVCNDDFFWEASFNVCVTVDGYANACQTADFDDGDDSDDRNFFLVPNASSTPTLTPEPTSTPTLTATLEATPTPTLTKTPAGKPTAVHPELDIDQDGVIGPGDLLYLLQDWLRPVH